MKLKHVNFFDLHAEKLILAAAILFSGLVLLSYFLVSPFTLTTGWGTGMRPEQTEQTVLRKAIELEQQIRPEAPSPLPEISIPPYTEMFRQRMARAPVQVDQFDPLSEPGLQDNMMGTSLAGPVPLTVPRPPAPHSVSAKTGFGVLLNKTALAESYAKESPYEAGSREALQYGWRVSEAFSALVPEQEPRDFRYATVVGVFDLEAWRRKLRSSGTDGVIPERWWRTMLDLTDVLLERQTYDPETGQWGQTVAIPILPGQLSFRDVPPDWPSKEQAQQVVRRIKNSQDQIARPPFVPMTEAARWDPPDLEAVVEGSLGASGAVRRLSEEIDRLTEQLSRLQILAQNSAPAADMFHVTQGSTPNVADQPTRPASETTGPGARVSSGGGGGGDSPSRGELLAQVSRVNQQLAEKTGARDRLLARIDAAGAAAPPSLTSNTPRPYPPAAEDQIAFWAHDITVRPGATYRYRVRVSVLNPLFQQEQLVEEQRRAYAGKLSLESTPSDWTPPVEVEPDHYFFLVGGTPRQQEATIEVWHVYNGRPRSDTLQLHPGDPIQVLLPYAAISPAAPQPSIVVDVLETTRGSGRLARKNIEMIYLDTQTGRLNRRTVETDSASDLRTRLRSATEVVNAEPSEPPVVP
jgi:hypothetical protein